MTQRREGFFNIGSRLVDRRIIHDAFATLTSTTLQQMHQELPAAEADLHHCPLVTDISIKEEPLDLKDPTSPAVKCLSKVPEEIIQEDGYTLPRTDDDRRGKSQHSTKCLHCPVCSISFRHGPYGSGLEMLVGHIHTKHRRLQVFCLSATRTRYLSIVKEAVAQGHLPPYSGLVLPSD